MQKELFQNADEFFELNGLKDKSHSAKYEAIVQALNFEACKEILFTYITYDKLLNAYKKDEHLNNILNQKIFNRNVLPRYFRYQCGTYWQWDIIGYQMLHNNKATIQFKLISLSTLTCIAKGCARLIIANENAVIDNV